MFICKMNEYVRAMWMSDVSMYTMVVAHLSATAYEYWFMNFSPRSLYSTVATVCTRVRAIARCSNRTHKQLCYVCIWNLKIVNWEMGRLKKLTHTLKSNRNTCTCIPQHGSASVHAHTHTDDMPTYVIHTLIIYLFCIWFGCGMRALVPRI